MTPTSRTAERSGLVAGGSAGFTLVELLVVLAMMALVAALAAPRIGPMTRGGLVAAAEEVAGALREARTRSLAEGRPVAVEIDTAVGRIAAGGRRALRTPPEVRIALIVAAAERISDTSGRIRFLPDGSSTGGRVTLRRGERTIDVGVDWLGGAVEVRDAPID